MTSAPASHPLSFTSTTSCGLDGSTDFESLWSLPSYPLTERFGPFESTDAWSCDQELLISTSTGHVQLRNQISPFELYSPDKYVFRTGRSVSSSRGVEFFKRYLKVLIGNRHFRSAVDIGGNDFSVARQLLEFAATAGVVDPVCEPEDGQCVLGVKIIGQFIESVDLSATFDRPDIVICRHTLEHLANPRGFLTQLFEQCDPDCLYVFEVPCLASLCEALRFDAIIHQHYHYFDLHSFNRLLWECGGEYIDHVYNHQGSNGGSLIVSFRRTRTTRECPRFDIGKKIAYLRNSIRMFKVQSDVMSDYLAELAPPVYGYGASLMLATFAFHLRTDFARLEFVIDDNPLLDRLTYSNVPVHVRSSERLAIEPNASFIVTSLENSRAILQKIAMLNPRRIVAPFVG